MNTILEKRLSKKIDAFKSAALDTFLEAILRLMQFVFFFDINFRKNIKNFNGRYAFKSKDGKIHASAVFLNDRMKVYNRAVKKTNVTVTFKDGNALRDFLFSQNPDILGSILDNSIAYEGNLNYLAKFAYMAKHLQLKFSL